MDDGRVFDGLSFMSCLFLLVKKANASCSTFDEHDTLHVDLLYNNIIIISIMYTSIIIAKNHPLASRLPQWPALSSNSRRTSSSPGPQKPHKYDILTLCIQYRNVL